MQHLVRGVDPTAPHRSDGVPDRRRCVRLDHRRGRRARGPDRGVARPEIAASGAVTPGVRGSARRRDGVAVVFDTALRRHRRSAAAVPGAPRTAPTSPSRPDSEVDSVPCRSMLDPAGTPAIPLERLRDAPSGAPPATWRLATSSRTCSPAPPACHPHQVAATVLWAGDLPSVDQRHRPSHRYRRCGFPPAPSTSAGSRTSTGDERTVRRPCCGSELRAATPVEQLVVVLHCSSVPPRTRRTPAERLIVVGPPEATTARVLDHRVRCSAATRWWTAWPSCRCRTTSPPSRSSTPSGDTLDARAPMGIADLSGD